MKLLFKFIAFIIVLAVFGAVEFVFVANRFAMLAVFNQDRARCTEIIQDSYKIYEDNSFYDITFDFANENTEEGNTDYSKGQIVLKYAKIDTTTTNFITTTKIESRTSGTVTSDEYTLYYKDGVLYKNDEGVKTQQTKTLSEASSEIGIGFYALYLTPALLTFDDSNPMNATMCFEFKPFYVGQLFTYNTENADFKFSVDYFGNLRKYVVDGQTTSNAYTTTSVYNGFTAPTLVFPEDLSTYGA
ncbi:MAG: hypothetical protein WCR30_01810 [Clostridia bacterium]